MPKCKHNKDIDDISDQIKKLKKRLKRVRKRVETSFSSGCESKSNNEDNALLEEHITEPEIGNIFNSDQILPENSDINQTSENTETTSELISNEQDPSTLSEVTNQEDTSLNKEILEILGEDPPSTIQYGPQIHKELASRLQHIATLGLTKETRKELQQKYLLPSNGILLGAPVINPEIKAALPETLVNRDKALETKQKLLASAISCVSSAISQMLRSSDKNNDLLRTLMDANRMLCDVQHSDSITRRMFSSSVLKKEVKTQILNSKIDKFLFGENLPDTLKTAKAVSKSSAEIKSTLYNNKKPQPSTSKASNLNMKAPVAPTLRPPATTQKTRQPAFHQNQPVRSSKTSSRPQKTTSYRR